MTDDLQQNQICLMVAQLTRDLKNTATDKEIQDRVYLAMRIQKIMVSMYGRDYSKTLVAPEAEVFAVVPNE